MASEVNRDLIPGDGVAASGLLVGPSTPSIRRRAAALVRELRRGDSFRGRVSVTLVVNLAQGGIGLATGVLTARLLGPLGRGELASITTWPFMIATLAMIGMPEALIYYAGRAPERLGQYFTTALLLITGVGLGAALTGWWLMPWLLHAQSPEIVHAARVCLLLIGSYAFAGLPHGLLRVLGAWHAWNALRLVPNLVWLLILGSAYLFPRLANSVDLSYWFVAAYTSTLIPLVFVLPRHGFRPGRPRGDCVRPLLSYGLPVMFSVLPQTMNLRLDQVVMAAFLEPTLLGFYIVAVSWSGILTPLVSSVGTVLFPHLSAISDRERQREVLTRITRRLVVVVAVCAVLLLAVTPWGLPVLFGAKFKAAIPAALILVAASGFSTMNSTFGASLQGLGRPSGVLISELVGLVVTTLLLLLLLPRFGILGAAIASLVSYVTTTVLLGTMIVKLLNARGPEQNREETPAGSLVS